MMNTRRILHGFGVAAVLCLACACDKGTLPDGPPAPVGHAADAGAKRQAKKTHKAKTEKHDEVNAGDDAEPTRDELIDAVKRAAQSETTVATKYRQVPQTRYCSQMDVATDPHMPSNPELARCPYAGKPVVQFISEPYRETVSCPPVPDMAGAWSVVQLREDHWRVSVNGRVWMVDKLSGEAHGVGTLITSRRQELMISSKGC